MGRTDPGTSGLTLLSLFTAVAILKLLHDFLGIGRVGRNTVDDVVPHGNGCCQRAFLTVVCFVGEVFRNHDPFAADAHPPSEEGGFFQGVSGDVLHMSCLGMVNVCVPYV